MSWRDQRGTSLVELLVSMAIAAVVLTGLTGVIFAANRVYTQWSAPLVAATTNAEIEQVAVNVQDDSHRLVPCVQAQGTVLGFCLPGPGGTQVVSYTSSAQGPSWEVLRSDLTSRPASTRIVARGLPGQPIFASTPPVACPGSGVGLGSIKLTVGGQVSWVVLYRGPVPC